MAEFIGAASGVVALAIFALQTSRILYQTLDSFTSNQKSIRALKEELEALQATLESLSEAVKQNEADLEALKLPLLRCGKACKDFEMVIVKCTTHSGGPRTSFRDWAKLTYMGGNIVAFKDMLAGYKATINIALGGATFRQSAVTLDVLKDYKTLISNTTADLEEHLQTISDQLQDLSSSPTKLNAEETAELAQLQEERDSTEQCLDICTRFSTFIVQVQPTISEDVRAYPVSDQAISVILGHNTSARRVTGKGIKECKDSMDNARASLAVHLQRINVRLAELSPSARQSGERAEEQQILLESKQSVESCLKVCSQAAELVEQPRINIAEDVLAEEDSYQFVVATLGDLISAKRVIAGPRAVQAVGQMSDTSLQQISLNSSRVSRSEPPGPSNEPEEFKNRHGAGYKLSHSLPRDRPTE